MRIQPLTAALIVITGCAADAPNVDADPTTKHEVTRGVDKPDVWRFEPPPITNYDLT
jgi:hypothetical protein